MVKVIHISKESIEVQRLIVCDPRIKTLIDVLGDYDLKLNTNLYSSIVRIIIGQQLSSKVAGTIWNRLVELCGEVTPRKITDIDTDELRKIGISKSKVKYIQELATRIVNKDINLEELVNKSNEEVINELIKVKGIGLWTAQMFLIFSLGRKDVFSNVDVGLKRGIKWLYNLEDLPNNEQLEDISEKWRPYRTIACLYLWKLVDSGLIKKPNPLS